MTDSAPAPAPAAPKRSRRFLPLLIVAALAAAYGAYRLYLWRQPYEWSGTVEARTISVGSRAGGRVKQVLVREGDRVTAGQPLLELEPGDLEAQRLQAQGQLAQARALEANASERMVRAGSRVEDIKAARGQVDAAQGRFDQIKTLLDELMVRAPRASRIEALDLRPGDIVAPNATCATLLEDDQLYVRIYVPETRIGRLQVGAQVPVTVDSFPGRSFQGVVEHINSVGEYSPRNLQTADERADQVFAARIGLKSGVNELRA